MAVGIHCKFPNLRFGFAYNPTAQHFNGLACKWADGENGLSRAIEQLVENVCDLDVEYIGLEEAVDDQLCGVRCGCAKVALHDGIVVDFPVGLSSYHRVAGKERFDRLGNFARVCMPVTRFQLFPGDRHRHAPVATSPWRKRGRRFPSARCRATSGRWRRAFCFPGRRRCSSPVVRAV